MTEDEMLQWLHGLSGHEFKQTPGDSEGQGKSGALRCTEQPRVGHDLVTKQEQHDVL